MKPTSPGPCISNKMKRNIGPTPRKNIPVTKNDDLGARPPPPRPHIHDYDAPSAPYVKPAHLLTPVPPAKAVDAVTNFHEDKKKTEGGCWRLSFSNWKVQSDHFVEDDWVILEVGSDCPYAARIGPFPLGSFPCKEVNEHEVMKEFPLSSNHLLNITLYTASGNVALASTCVLLNADVTVGTTHTKNQQQLCLMDHIGRARPHAGVSFSLTATLCHMHRPVDVVLEDIFAATGFGDAILTDEEAKASFRLTLNDRYNGEWWALSSTNKARAEVCVPHSAGVNKGMCSGISNDGHPGASDKYNRKPLVEFLKAYRICRVLPLVQDWHNTLPTLKLLVRTIKGKSRRYGTDVLLFKTQLLFEGVEVHPWYNFDSWGVAYPKSNNSQQTDFDLHDTDGAETLRAQLETALNAVVGVWVDVPNHRIVVYGNEAYVGEVAIRAMHVTIPVTQEFIDKYLPKAAPPKLIKF